MKKLLKQSLVSAAVFMAVSGVAQAKVAQITGISGSAMVERSSFRYIAQEGMVLEDGDVVRALENSKVNIQFASCKSTVAAAKEAKISSKNPCATATVAKASDLKPLQASKHAIKRIDANAAEVACKSCAVDMSGKEVRLASSSGSSLFTNLAKAAIIPAGAALAASGGSSSSSAPTSSSNISNPNPSNTPISP